MKVNRNQMSKRLPKCLQPLITFITGKAYSGQKPLWKSSPLEETLTTLGFFILGMMIIFYILNY